jgi:hypothetical protein
MNVTVKTKPVVTLTLSIEEAAALSAAAYNFYEARESMIRESGSGTVNLKDGAHKDLQRVAFGLIGAIDHHQREAVWDYANLNRPSQPTPDSSLGDDDDDCREPMKGAGTA